MKTQAIYLILIGLLIGVLSSCEKVIEVDLNSANPQLSIEAGLTYGENQLEVKVSRTSDYFGTEPPTPVTNASVTLVDGSGNPLPVPHTGDGNYALPVQAAPAENYHLEVNVDGEMYRASAVVPEYVEIQTLRATESQFVGGLGNPQDDTTRFLVLCGFRDPATANNYYRLSYRLNGQAADPSIITIIDDKNFNGNVQEVPVQFGESQFKSGDTVEVSLHSIDRATYDYFQALSGLVSSGQAGPPGGSAAPGNPEGNWDGKALGHFALTARDTQVIVIP